MAIAPESTENGRWLSVGGLRERRCAHLSRLEGSWHGRVTPHPRRGRADKHALARSPNSRRFFFSNSSAYFLGCPRLPGIPQALHDQPFVVRIWPSGLDW
jgi:hypothetical protein